MIKHIISTQMEGLSATQIAWRQGRGDHIAILAVAGRLTSVKKQENMKEIYNEQQEMSLEIPSKGLAYFLVVYQL